ncbi:hypothetical protein NHQ30_010285 [Ciborinia camelliae]|nr:hypothetical protein NHQ30_010285 [Ciborinia camelliae]
MQMNMERAIRESGFGGVENDNVDNLFIVLEPEAAAAYMLTSTTTVLPGETFLLIDPGEGTVDSITYTVDNAYPLRRSRRLKGEDYLKVNNMTIEGIINEAATSFENDIKRYVDVTADNVPTEIVFLKGLLPNPSPEKRFLSNRVKIEWLVAS